jgi:hypothetical protein
VFTVVATGGTCSVYDGNAAGDVAAGNLIATLVTGTSTIATLNFPLQKGLILVAGSSCAVSYSGN